MAAKDPMIHELNERIDTWLEAKERRNLAILANMSQVAYSTLRRIRNNEAKAKATTVLAISEIVMHTSDRVKFFEKYFPSIGKIMASAYPQEDEFQAISEKVKKYLRRDPHNKIFNMAATSAGIAEKDIRRHLGEVGLVALEELLEDEVLFAQNGRIKFARDHWTLANADDMLNQIRRSVDYFDKSLVGTDYAMLVNNTGSIKASHLPKVKALIEKFAIELAEIKNDPEAEGPVCFFCNVSYSLFDKAQIQVKEENS